MPNFQKSAPAIIGYKKAAICSCPKKERIWCFCEKEVIVTLLIPAKARRIKGEDGNWNHKCRADRAKVLAVSKKLKKGQRVVSGWDRGFTYRVGATVKPLKRFVTKKETCASGVHFYLTRKQAKEHVL